MKVTATIAVLTFISAGQLVGQAVDRPLQVSGDVMPPVLIKQVDPKFSSKMREKAGDQDVLVHLIVDDKGMPTNVKVVWRGAEVLTGDPEFETSAVEAVKQYRFRPATKLHAPVAVEMNVDVAFHVLAK